MFFGEYSHQVDGNKRIRIPTPFKNELGSCFYMAKGLDGVINILPAEIVRGQVAELEKISDFDTDGQEAALEYMSNVFEVTEDGQGRVKIPSQLYDFAGFKDEKNIVTVGMGRRLSLMTRSLREEKRNKRTHSEIMSILDEKIK